jgi:hypothetical protein
MESRIERVVFETDRHRIVGDLNLPKEGHRSRLSDFLNRGDLTFIPLVNVELTPLGSNGAVPEQYGFLAVARSHIQLAHPLEHG